MQDFRKLQIWQLSHELTLKLYKVVSSFPDSEKYNLTSQIKRSASSIPANIAEGCGRKTNGELEHFLYIAMGSASELEYHLLLSKDLGIIDTNLHSELENDIIILRKKMNVFIQRVSAKRK
ncbi:MAG: four helix bundle protein [Chloroflexota bacterium]